jgi:hypothetical protein
MLVWGLLVLATLVTFVAALALWANRQFLSTDNWTKSSGALLQNDDVRGTLSTRMVDALFQRTNASGQLEDRLPKQIQGAAPVVAAGLQTAATRAADTLLATPRAQNLWEDVNRTMHRQLIAVLEKKTVDGISGGEGTVTLDLRPFLGNLADRLGLSDRLKQGASPTAGQIVLVRSDQLKTAQTIVRILHSLSPWIAFAGLVLYALAIYLARGRQRRMLEWTGVSLVFVGLVILIVRRYVGHGVVDSYVKTEANRPAVRAIWEIETNLLRDVGLALLLYGVLAIIAGILGGPSRIATTIRRWLAPAFRDQPAVVYTVAVIAFLLFIAWGPTAASRRLIGVLILAALLGLGLELWRQQTLREFPASSPAPVPPSPPPAPVEEAGARGRADQPPS